MPRTCHLIVTMLPLHSSYDILQTSLFIAYATMELEAFWEDLSGHIRAWKE